MILVIDANIVFSILINPKGIVGKKFIELATDELFIAPAFLKAEIAKHQSRIAEITKQPLIKIELLRDFIFEKIHFYPLEKVPVEFDNHALALLKGYDQKDVPYLAFALYYSALIWTGDKPIRTALEAKGFNICISTQELSTKNL
jgi:predicted nucleic acid-binding protein